MIRQIRPWWKLFRFTFVLIGHFLWLLTDMLFAGKHHHRGLRIRRSFCKSALRAFDIRVKVIGQYKDQQGLIISNHRSMLDPLIQLAYLDVYILSKAEVGNYPMIGRGSRETGVLFVERDKDSSRKAALRSIENLLLAGSGVLIYPEGTTYTGDLTGNFRKGSFEVASQHNIPVVPVMIEYPSPDYYWGDGSLLEYFKRIFAKPGPHNVVLRIGEKIQNPHAEALSSTVQQEINRMIIEARQGIGLPKT